MTLRSWRVWGNWQQEANLILLQWGHDLAVMESWSPYRKAQARLLLRFNGAMTLRSWRGKKPRTHSTAPVGFNGAMTLRSWRGAHFWVTSVADGGASMGP